MNGQMWYLKYHPADGRKLMSPETKAKIKTILEGLVKAGKIHSFFIGFLEKNNPKTEVFKISRTNDHRCGAVYDSIATLEGVERFIAYRDADHYNAYDM